VQRGLERTAEYEMRMERMMGSMKKSLKDS
jgi:hypothetical protein